MYRSASKGMHWDLFFVIGIILTTMTRLRFGDFPVGAGELLLIIWILQSWAKVLLIGSIRYKKYLMVFVLFWVLFFIILLLGILTSSAKSSLFIKSAVYDLVAYLFSFVLCITLVLTDSEIGYYRKLKYLAILGGLTFGVLLIWWKLVGPNFLGLNIVYGNARFTGGANNPNQLALFLVSIPALLLFFLSKWNCKNNLGKKVILVFILFLSLYAGLNTQSDAFNGTLLLTLILGIVLSVLRRFKYPLNIFILLVLFIVALIGILVNIEFLGKISNEIVSIFKHLDKDGSRIFLWVQGVKAALMSPIVGYGSGARVVVGPDYFMEAHNTVIDLMIQAGFVGLMLYLVLLTSIFYKVKANIYLLLALFSLIVYSFAHFVFRQPVFWVYLILLIGAKYYCDSSEVSPT